MTFVGKILVIVIMAFALLFLGISTVTFTTSVNWKEATGKERQKVQDLTKKTGDLTAAIDAAKKDLEKSRADHQAELEQKANQIKALDDEIKNAGVETSAARTQFETAQQRANTALAEAASNRQETEQLREMKKSVEQQANEYKLQQTELLDKIREQERQIKTIDDNNKDLRDRVARYSTLLRTHGLSDDIATVTGLESPPAVTGEVARVDVKNSRFEITVGSDDGLVPGHELYVFRTKPQPQYLGKIEIMSTDPDQAVGKLIGRTVNGLKIQEGDIVSSTIRPRS